MFIVFFNETVNKNLSRNWEKFQEIFNLHPTHIYSTLRISSSSDKLTLSLQEGTLHGDCMRCLKFYVYKAANVKQVFQPCQHGPRARRCKAKTKAKANWT